MHSTFSYIIFGILGGLLAWPCSKLTGFHSQNRIDNWIKYLFTVGTFGTEKQVLQRAKWLAAPPWLLFIRGQIPAILGLSIGLLPLIIGKNPAAVAMFVALYVMFSGPALERKFLLDPNSFRFTFSLDILNQIAIEIAASFSTSQSKALFKEWALTKFPNVREAACIGIASLPQETAVPLLHKMVNDPDSVIHEIACQKLIEFGEIPILKPRPLNNSSKSKKLEIPGSKPGDWFRAQAKPHRIIEFKNWDNDQPQNMTLKKAFPNLYCRDCFRFAEKITNGHFSLFRCPKCKKDVFLAYGFTKLVGQIGGAIDFVQQDAVIKVQVWNEKLNQITGADFQTLEIIGGNDKLDYDWAVSAVIAQLHKNTKHLKNFEIILLNDPPISENTKRILDAFVVAYAKSKK